MEVSPEEESSFKFSKKINFVLAISAMLISIASFYATYIQAVSSEQQVKAMTYPLIQFTSGNFDLEHKEAKLYLSLKNSGVGPALIKTVEYIYKDQPYSNTMKFLKACCKEELEAFRSAENQARSNYDAQIVTSQDRGIVLAAADQINVIQLFRHESNEALWEKFNKERRLLEVSVCYCSLLDNCYVSNGRESVKEVDRCK